jgi:hypothetical protein
MNELAFTWIDVPDPQVDEIARILAAHPRMAGYYILRLVDITTIRAQVSEDRMIDAVFQHFDGRKWPAFEDRIGLGSWSDSEVTAESAQAEVVAAPIGGGAIGHTRDTMSAASALQTWQRFASLFGPDRRYFIGMGLGDPRYVFQSGAAIVDATRAGYIGVVESD